MIYLVTVNEYWEGHNVIDWRIAGAFTTKESAEKFAESYKSFNPKYEWIEIREQTVSD